MKLSLLLLVVFFSFSCSQDSPTDPVDPNLPTVTTSAVNSITSAGAIGGGSVTADAGSPVTVRGLCIKTSPGASISDRVIISGAGVGDFNVAIDALTSNSTYFIKAFATNSAGTAYGAEISFSTLQGANASTVLVGAMDSLYSLRADNGALKWKKKLTGNVLSTTYAKGKIFVVTEDKKLHCYDTTGNFSWQKSYAADIKELPVVIGNDVYLLTDNIFLL